MSHRPLIFFDPFGRRARLTTVALSLLSILVLAGLAAGAVGVLVAPSLRGDLERDRAEVVGTIAPAFRSAGQGQIQVNPMRNRQLPPSAASIRRLAFMSMQPSAVASLKRNAASLNGIIPHWLTLNKPVVWRMWWKFRLAVSERVDGGPLQAARSRVSGQGDWVKESVTKRGCCEAMGAFRFGMGGHRGKVGCVCGNDCLS
jgi:hypothetical protein